MQKHNKREAVGMKRITAAKVCNILSLALLLCFIVNTAIDYAGYSTTLNSAPFYLWVIVNAAYFVIPAIIVFVVGIFIKNKTKSGL